MLVKRLKNMAGALLSVTLLVGTAQAAGIGYVKVCNSGQRAGKGTCPIDPVLGSQADNWACTWDTDNGLLWHMLLDDGGPLDKDRQFTRFNRGESGFRSPTDAAGYVAEVRDLRPCNVGRWRMPSLGELRSIVNLQFQRPAVDPNWFPNTRSWMYWTSDTDSRYPDEAVVLWFDFGSPDGNKRFSSANVRLVVTKPYGP